MEKLLRVYEGKNKEEALEKCLTELNIEEKELYIKELDKESGLFKSKKTVIEVVSKDDLVNYIKEYIKELGKLMKIDMIAEVLVKDDTYNISLVTAKTPIIIGKDGRTLDAIQLLLRQSINKQTNLNIKLVVDASGYKNKKAKNFEYEIKKIAKGVFYSKTEAKLDPMNSFERRVVHTIVGEFANLESESIGEEPNRCVVIKYKED